MGKHWSGEYSMVNNFDVLKSESGDEVRYPIWTKTRDIHAFGFLKTKKGKHKS